MRISDWSSDVCSSDLERWRADGMVDREIYLKAGAQGLLCTWADEKYGGAGIDDFRFEQIIIEENMRHGDIGFYINLHNDLVAPYIAKLGTEEQKDRRSEEHTSELQSLMRNSYAVFCLKKKKSQP